jgi:hypothetical protein
MTGGGLDLSVSGKGQLASCCEHGLRNILAISWSA